MDLFWLTCLGTKLHISLIQIYDIVVFMQVGVSRNAICGCLGLVTGHNRAEYVNLCVSFQISRRSDVWSLGCILYNFVYGSTPFGHIKQVGPSTHS